MNIIKPNAKYLSTDDTTPYQFIEKVGRICYKSEDKIADGTDINFIKMLQSNKHFAMFEHARIYMKCNGEFIGQLNRDMTSLHWLYNNSTKPSMNNILNHIAIDRLYVSGSFRAWLELIEMNRDAGYPSDALTYITNRLNTFYPELFKKPDTNQLDIKFFTAMNRFDVSILSRDKFIKDMMSNDCEQLLSHHLAHTVLFTCDRGVSHELVRHRLASFAQESTRYCNYSQDKFGREITVIEPVFFGKDAIQYRIWQESCKNAEANYFALLDNNATAQEARSVLPNSLKTEIVVTATENEWQHIINLRMKGTTGMPHPQMREVMQIAYPQLVAESNNRLS